MDVPAAYDGTRTPAVALRAALVVVLAVDVGRELAERNNSII